MSTLRLENLKLTIFGASHSPEIGMTLEGPLAGKTFDMAELQRFMERRAPGRNDLSTPRKEPDKPVFREGVRRLSGAGSEGASPDGGEDTNSDGTDIYEITADKITAVIVNTNTRSKDYADIANIPRPGHADYTAEVKYFGKQEKAGGGEFSGRLTAPMCIAGGILKQLLEKEGMQIISRISSIGNIYDEGELTKSTADKAFPVVSDEQGEAMRALILQKKSELDSVGGTVECKILNPAKGLGGPQFEGMEGRIAQVVFGIPAAKGIEFGAGFKAAELSGSENNDEFYVDNGEVKTRTNNCGGILGGITDGMPLTFRVAFKPTPSIARPQKSVDLSTMTDTVIEIKGRHDPCIVQRAIVVVEAAAAIATYDAFITRTEEVK